jgi:SPP1 gp7 family putative phage head morphogenesis protein
MVDRKDWKTRSGAERRYVSSIGQITKFVRRIVQTCSTLQEITAAIEALTDNPEWQELARTEARKMVQSVAVSNAKTWREAAARSHRGAEIHRLLKAEIEQHGPFLKIVQQNAQLIRSLPSDIARHISEHAASQAIAGMRAESLLRDIRKAAPELSQARVLLIARTETAKAQAAVTQVRAVQLGIERYIWRTSEDQRVRSSHKHMEGVVCSFSSPPSPEAYIGETKVGYYGPGGVWNCRCWSQPLIDLDFMNFPVKVAQREGIVRMTRREFEAFQ